MENYTLTGILAKDCEVATTDSGKQVIKFSIPENKKWKDKNGEKHEKTKWVSCVWWNDNAIIPQYLKKGMCVSIVGEPEASAYIDNAGKAVAKLECKVLSLNLIGMIKTKETSDVNSNTPAVEPDNTDDLPF